jgi:hypothetical protein
MIASPAAGAVAITPHDTNPLTTAPTRGLYVGGAGNLKVTMADGSVATFSGVAAGSLLPIRVNIVWAAGTTATLILGLY